MSISAVSTVHFKEVKSYTDSGGTNKTISFTSNRQTMTKEWKQKKENLNCKKIYVASSEIISRKLPVLDSVSNPSKFILLGRNYRKI